MQFELTQALIDEILFFMEDQGGDFLLDTREGIVISTDVEDFNEDDDDDDRYISLPDWEPSDGFRLMERFTAGLRNALVREELSAALDRGRGVFRAFKDTLAQYPEPEKLWFAYKDREMKRTVIAWYNSLRESWGLELIGEEPEDISGLVLEDFRFRAGTAQDKDQAEALHQVCLSEYGSVQKSIHADVYKSIYSSWIFPGDLCFVAETAGEEFAGYISAVRNDTVLRVCAVEVQSEYRGLGLGKALIARLLEWVDCRRGYEVPETNTLPKRQPQVVDSEKIAHVIIDLPAGQEFFSRALLRENFTLGVQRYWRGGLHGSEK